MASERASAQVPPRSLTLTWDQIQDAAHRLVDRTIFTRGQGVYGVPTGGSIVAALVSERALQPMLDEPRAGCLVVDDLVDSGRTLAPYAAMGMKTDALFRKPHSPYRLAPEADTVEGWVKFPWEHETGAEENVVRLLEYVGEDPTREGLRDTPKRYLKALRELTSGYSADVPEILSKVFEETYDQMVVVRGIESWSLCEHHILPFRLEAVVGYIPNGRVLGLSKIARLVHAYARRLQVQERLTEQIARSLNDVLKPSGVGVLIRGWHTCMCMRGIRTDGEMVTNCLLGSMRSESSARTEFLNLARQK